MTSAIINGLIYDTDNAELIVQTEIFPGRQYSASEELYRTRNGNYFIVDQESIIRVIDEKGRIDYRDEGEYGRSESASYNTIQRWLRIMKVNDLKEREIEYFNIQYA